MTVGRNTCMLRREAPDKVVGSGGVDGRERRKGLGIGGTA
jgi:hypothetical protein